MHLSRQASGRHAEDAVLATAKQRGWTFLQRNFRTRHGELDLICSDQGTLIIIEVRLRQHSDYGAAAATVTRQKQSRIIAATKQFLLDNPRWADAPLRFDVVGLDGNGISDWIEAAFICDEQ